MNIAFSGYAISNHKIDVGVTPSSGEKFIRNDYKSGKNCFGGGRGK